MEDGQEDAVTAEASVPNRVAWLSTERAEKVPELVARRIVREITVNRLQAGHRLPPESEMLARFGVGRASLREALRILEAYGLIRVRPGPRGGPVVTDVKPSAFAQATTLHLHRRGATFRELLEARLVLEPVMARLAAQQLTPASAEHLRDTTQLGRDALEAALEVFSAATAAFHTVVAGTSGNRVLDLYSSALVAIERESVATAFTERTERELTQHVHEQIADAVLSGDGDRAEDLSRRHIRALVRHWEATRPRFLDEGIQWR